MERSARRQPAAPARGLSRTSLLAGALTAVAAVAVLLRHVERTDAPVGRGVDRAAAERPIPGRFDPGPDAVEPAGGVPERHPFQGELIAMAASERTSVLRLAIRDSSLECEDVTGVVALGPDIPVWRVACSGARAYIVGVDNLGRIEIDPQIYHEPTVVPPAGPPGRGDGTAPLRPPSRFDRAPLERPR